MVRTKLVLLLLASVCFAHAGVTFSGILDPASNPNLTYWDQFLNSYTAPITGPDVADRAYNIAVHTFAVGVAGPVAFASNGYGMGGFDSVVAVFQGTGDSAVYVDHEYAPLGPGDFSFDLSLGVGTYTLAVSMFGSVPCAPGFCGGPLAGTFGDGYTNLVNFDPSQQNPLFYSVDVNPPIPEPSFAIPVAACVAVFLTRKRLGRRPAAL